ncbi:MAG: hypothetical protein ABIP41_09305 [Croceibacterium sp.]
MAGPKRPKLDCGDSDRSDMRQAVRIAATCQIGERAAEETFVIGLSRAGCELLTLTIGVVKAAPVVLRIADEAPIAGRLNWVGQGAIGVAFDKLLADEVLERVSGLAAPSNVVPLKRAR